MCFVLHNFIVLIQFFLASVGPFNPHLMQLYVDFFFRHLCLNYITNTYYDSRMIFLTIFLTSVLFKTSDLESVAIN
jgi:hypothetical protein